MCGRHCASTGSAWFTCAPCAGVQRRHCADGASALVASIENGRTRGNFARHCVRAVRAADCSAAATASVHGEPRAGAQWWPQRIPGKHGGCFGMGSSAPTQAVSSRPVSRVTISGCRETRGGLVAAAYLTRSIGITLALGILLALAWRRRWFRAGGVATRRMLSATERKFMSGLRVTHLRGKRWRGRTHRRCFVRVASTGGVRRAVREVATSPAPARARSTRRCRADRCRARARGAGTGSAGCGTAPSRARRGSGAPAPGRSRPSRG